MFLHGKFLDYGSRLLSYYQVSTISTLYLLYLRNIYIYNIYQNYDVAWDPMDEVFPKMAKCQFNRHGPGGGIQVSIYIYLHINMNHRVILLRTTTPSACSPSTS